MAEPLQVAKLVGIYRQLRDQKAEIATKAKEAAAEVQGKMDRIEAALLKLFQTQGVDSMRTSEGTAYRQEKTFASVADWDALLAYIREKEAFELLTRGVSKDAVLAFKEEHGDIPPGVNLRNEFVINVRAS